MQKQSLCKIPSIIMVKYVPDQQLKGQIVIQNLSFQTLSYKLRTNNAQNYRVPTKSQANINQLQTIKIPFVRNKISIQHYDAIKHGFQKFNQKIQIAVKIQNKNHQSNNQKELSYTYIIKVQLYQQQPKQQQHQPNNHQNSLLSQDLIIKVSNTKKQCINHCNVTYVCADQTCDKPNPFICSNESCQCSINHQECKQIKIKVLQHKIQNYLNQQQNKAQQVKDKINNYFDQLISYLQKQKNEILLKISEKKNPWVHSASQKNNKQQQFTSPQKINGKMICQLLDKSDNQSESNQWIEVQIKKVIKQIQLQTNKVKKRLQKYTKSLEQVMFKRSNQIFNLDWQLLNAHNYQIQLKAQDIVRQYLLRLSTIQYQSKYILNSSSPHLRSASLSQCCAVSFLSSNNTEEMRQGAYVNIFERSLKSVANMTIQQLRKDKKLFQKIKTKLQSHNKLQPCLIGWFTFKTYQQKLETFLLSKLVCSIMIQLMSLLCYLIVNKNKSQIPHWTSQRIQNIVKIITALHSVNQRLIAQSNEIKQFYQIMGVFISHCVFYPNCKLKFNRKDLKLILSEQKMKIMEIMNIKINDEEYDRNNYQKCAKQKVKRLRQYEENWDLQDIGISLKTQKYFQEIHKIMQKTRQRNIKFQEQISKGKVGPVNLQTGQIISNQQQQKIMKLI